MEIKKITLPISKKEVEISSVIKAGIMIDFQNIPIANRTKFLIENIIISIDDKKENIYNLIRELDFNDYKVIDAEIVKLMEGKELKKV